MGMACLLHALYKNPHEHLQAPLASAVFQVLYQHHPHHSTSALTDTTNSTSQSLDSRSSAYNDTTQDVYHTQRVGRRINDRDGNETAGTVTYVFCLGVVYVSVRPV